MSAFDPKRSLARLPILLLPLQAKVLFAGTVSLLPLRSAASVVVDTNQRFAHYGSMDPMAIAHALRNDIESATLPPGAILKQETLAHRFNVSRQPIRQALNHLLASGLVRRRSDRSLEVTGLTDVEARELLSVRTALEAMALRASVANLNAAALRQADRIAEDIQYEEDPRALEDMDVAFHQTLYSGCANARLLSLIEDLRREERRTYVRQLHDPARKVALQLEHQTILAAIRKGDVEAALTALSAHIDGCADDLVQPEISS